MRLPGAPRAARPTTLATPNSRAFLRLGIFLRASTDSAVSISARIDARLVMVGLGEDPAPGIDDQRMAEGLAAVLVLAALRGGDHEGAVLDGAGAQQHMPMRLRRSGG